jgi:hypothetical protein
MHPDLPTHYLGVKVGNGYLVPPVDMHESVAYRRFFEAADAGDEIARRVLSTITSLTNHEHDWLRDTTGVLVTPGRDQWLLSSGHWPRSFSGTPLHRLQECARNGSFIAERALAHITRQRITNPDFEVREAQ